MSISKTARGSVVLSEIQKNTEKNPTLPKGILLIVLENR